MSENEQLTVAELLARARQDKADAPAPRRRRRRSLEDGGVSVAELTGSFKAVQAEPIQPKHSSVPLDAEVGDRSKAHEKPQPEVDSSENAAAETPTSEDSHDVAESGVAETEAAKEATTGKSRSGQKAPSEEDTGVIDKVEETPGLLLAGDVTPADAEPTQDDSAEDDSAEAAADVDSLNSEESSDGDDLVQENQQTDEKNIAEEGSTDATGGFADAAETSVLPRVADEVNPLAVSRPASALVRDEDEAAPDLVAAQQDSNSSDLPVEMSPETDPDLSAEDVDPVEEEEGALGVIGIVLLALLGVVVGVVIFLGFEWLWSHLNRALVAILALATTTGVVLGVRSLRTSNDGLSMALAGLVGLLVTFAPAALLLV